MTRIIVLLLLFSVLFSSCEFEEERSEDFLSLSKEYLNSDLNLASDYAYTALNEASTADEEFEAYFILGYIENKMGNVRVAIAHYVEALEIYGENEKSVAVYKNLGSIFRRLNNHERAIKYYETGLVLADDLKKVEFHHLMGRSYLDKEEYENAGIHFEQGLTISTEKSHLRKIAVSYNLLGLLQKRIGNVDKAKEYYNEVINLKELESYNSRAGIAYHNLGDLYLNEGKYTDAVIYFEKALELKEKESSRFISLMDLGECYFKLNDLSKAEEHFNKALDLFGHTSKSPDHIKIYDHLKNLAVLKNDPAKALEFSEKYNEANLSYFQLRDESLQSNTIAAFESYADLYGDGLTKEKTIRKWFLSTWSIAVGTFFLIIALMMVWRMVAKRRTRMKFELMELVENL